MLDADEKIEVEKMINLRIKKLEARIAEPVSNDNSRPPQRIILTKSDIAVSIALLCVLVLSLAVASYFTDALLHDRLLKASLVITERLSAPLGAKLARIVGDATPPFLIVTGWLTIAFVWLDFFVRLVGFWKRNIKVEI
jgi:hypothetical protein